MASDSLRLRSRKVVELLLIMSVNTLKCTKCNVVISEVLAFIRNRHDVMDNESLLRICVSAFSEEEIDEAKK